MQWLDFIIFVTITASTPGPNNIISLTSSSKNGYKGSFALLSGLATGVFSVMLICSLFCASLSYFVHNLLLPMKIIGASYILYLAYKNYKRGEIKEDNKTLNLKMDLF